MSDIETKFTTGVELTGAALALFNAGANPGILTGKTQQPRTSERGYVNPNLGISDIMPKKSTANLAFPQLPLMGGGPPVMPSINPSSNATSGSDAFTEGGQESYSQSRQDVSAGGVRSVSFGGGNTSLIIIGAMAVASFVALMFISKS